MELVLITFGLGVAFELISHLIFRAGFWPKIICWINILLVLISSAAFVFAWPSLLSIGFALVGIYRLLNIVRILKQRINIPHLRSVSLRTSLWLILAQVAALALTWIWPMLVMEQPAVWLVITALQTFVGVVFLASVQRRMKRTEYQPASKHFSDVQLPTVTVAIPARNETSDLQECLETVIASDYPKLEVLVFDDCSQDKRTPAIIRAFAQSGVRFLQGDEPRPTWLAKNHAYERLLREATGEVVIFCGADIRFGEQTIRHLATLMLARKKAMISILPNYIRTGMPHISIIQSVRYWWELAPPRRMFNRPPVLSSCWVADKAALQKAGGFAAVARSIVPEAYFAKAMIIGDRYSFVRSNEKLGVGSVKSGIAQFNTAIRTRYPQVHRRPEQVLLISILEFIFFVLPFLLIVAGWWLPIGAAVHILTVLSSLLLAMTYIRVTLANGQRFWSPTVLGLPVAIGLDIVLLNASMWQYEFRTIEWRGRNVCIPVMRAYPSLPRLD